MLSGTITVYDIGWPFAIRSPFGPILNPAWSSSWFAFARSNGGGLIAGLYQWPVAGPMIEDPGCP